MFFSFTYVCDCYRLRMRKHRDVNSSSSVSGAKLMDAVADDSSADDSFCDDEFAGSMVPENAVLKPKLDKIFSDVEINLPTIDFDVSDVSLLNFKSK